MSKELKWPEPVALDHIACIEDGELRFMSCRKAPAHDCELYAMPRGERAPDLYTAAQVREMLASLRSELEAATVPETEVHEPKCPALDGGDCICPRSDKHNEAVDRSWARYCAKFGDGPDAPYPGMISAFERYYSQSFTDKEWRTESAVWAAAWKAALLAADPQRKLDDLEIKNASLESEVFHLSTLCDEQRAILVDVEMECGTDAYGAEFEDGDSKIIDRVRAHLAMLTSPTPNPQSPTTQPSE